MIAAEMSMGFSTTLVLVTALVGSWHAGGRIRRHLRSRRPNHTLEALARIWQRQAHDHRRVS